MNNINGKWRVSITAGPFWFRLMRNRDVKHIENNEGHNRMFGVEWGSFKVSYDGDEIIFTYDGDYIVDKMRFVSKDTLRGQLYLDKIEVGTFIMERIK